MGSYFCNTWWLWGMSPSTTKVGTQPAKGKQWEQMRRIIFGHGWQIQKTFQWGACPWPGETSTQSTQLFQDNVLIIAAASTSKLGVQLTCYFSAIPLPLSFFPLYPSPLFQPFWPQIFCWICSWISFAEFWPFCVYTTIDLLCSKHPATVRATLLFVVNFGIWKAQASLFSSTKQCFYSCVSTLKMMELLERKKTLLHYFPPFHFLAWLLSFQPSAQVRGNCLGSELEARDWHLLKWNTSHSLHFLIKPQAFPSS